MDVFGLWLMSNMSTSASTVPDSHLHRAAYVQPIFPLLIILTRTHMLVVPTGLERRVLP